jgi:hypothetical protein
MDTVCVLLVDLYAYKSSPTTHLWRRRGERRYSSYLFTTSALEGEVSGERHAPAALDHREKDPRYPLDRRLGGPHSRSGHRGQKKILYLCRGSNLDRPV